MSDRYFQHTYPNGLTLLAEKMPGMQSAALTLLAPAGVSAEPTGKFGIGAVLTDLMLRGAGDRDNRALTDHLDGLGLQRGSSIGTHHARFSAAAVAANVMAALPAYADILRRPMLPPDGFSAARDLALQALEGVEDDPRHKVMIKLRECHFPSPFGRNTLGLKPDLENLTLDDCKHQFQARYGPAGAIISLAGNIEFASIQAEVGRLFADWTGSACTEPPRGRPQSSPGHEYHKSEQTHIAIACPSIEEVHPQYYVMRLAVEALSGGMSARLFTEIREKRALVYSVSAGYASVKGYGCIMGYAGTSNDRAQATLDTFIAELRRLADGITSAELNRAKTGLKAATIMQGESTSARAGSIAHDYFMRGRIRTLEEVKSAIDSITLDQVNDYLKHNPLGPFTIVTVGPKELSPVR